MIHKCLIAIAGAGVLSVAAPLLAHHAFSAEFDAKAPVTLHGPVTKVEWINPHAWIHMEVKKPDGKTEIWMVEGGTPNTLQRRGITRDSIKIGTVIVVAGFRPRTAGCGPTAATSRSPTAARSSWARRAPARPRTAATRTKSPSRRGSDDDARASRAQRSLAVVLGVHRGGVRRRRHSRRRTARRARPTARRTQRHLAGEQHRELGPRGARGAPGPGVRAGRRLQRAARPRRRRGRRDPVPAGGAREEEGERRRTG